MESDKKFFVILKNPPYEKFSTLAVYWTMPLLLDMLDLPREEPTLGTK